MGGKGEFPRCQLPVPGFQQGPPQGSRLGKLVLIKAIEWNWGILKCEEMEGADKAGHVQWYWVDKRCVRPPSKPVSKIRICICFPLDLYFFKEDWKLLGETLQDEHDLCWKLWAWPAREEG